MKKKSEILKIIDDGLEELASHYGLLVVSKAKAKANVFAISFSQSIISSNFYLGEKGFFESYSESQFLTTSDRSYHEGKGVIHTYSSPNSAFMKAHPKDYSYDEFIRKYGKLITRKLYFSKIHPINKQDLVQEAYMEKDGIGAKKMVGFINYVFPEEGIKTFKEENNTITLELNPEYTHAYFRTQMRSIGRLEAYPLMKYSSVTFGFDERGKITSLKAIDDFSAKTGILSSAIHMELESTYQTSDNDSFVINGENKTLHLPSIEESFDVYGDEN